MGKTGYLAFLLEKSASLLHHPFRSQYNSPMYRSTQEIPLMKKHLFAFTILGCSIALVPGCSTFPFKSSGASDIAARKTNPVEVAPQIQPPAPATLKSELIIPDHPSIDYWVGRYSEKNHKSFQTQLNRACNYVVPAEEIFARKGLPKDLVYVALVESGFSPTARSHANAVGMWQIISKTGNRFGLEQNQYIDERRHPMKSAQAAADYLSFLYDTFKSWPLALAGYNAGENTVQTALDKSGLKDFWALRENGYLPTETRDYVPKVLATVKIIRSPKQYGFYYNPQQYVKKHETVKVPGGVKLSWIEKKTGIPEDSLISCNPELCKSVTPPNCSDYELCVPVGCSEDILAQLANCSPLDGKAEKVEKVERKALAASPTPAVTVSASYKIKRGDTLTSIARKNNCSAALLASLNGMKPSQALQAGRTIKLPGKPNVTASVSAKEISAAPVAAEKVKSGKNAAVPVSVAEVKPAKNTVVAPAPAKVGSAPVAAAKIKPAKDAAVPGAVAKAKPGKAAVTTPASAKQASAPVITAKTKRGKAAVTASGQAKAKPAGTGPKAVHYVVRQGDTLSAIADKFHIPVKTLCAQNDLKANQKLIPGNSLTVYSQQEAPERISKKKGN